MLFFLGEALRIDTIHFLIDLTRIMLMRELLIVLFLSVSNNHLFLPIIYLYF